MTRPVRYRCPDHGGFVAHVRCGHGPGRAPDAVLCPSCAAPSVRDYTRIARSSAGMTRRMIDLPARTAERLTAYCEAQGISIDAALDALVPDSRPKP